MLNQSDFTLDGRGIDLVFSCPFPAPGETKKVDSGQERFFDRAPGLQLLSRALGSSRTDPGYALHEALRRILAPGLSLHVDHNKLDGRAADSGRELAVGRMICAAGGSGD